MQGGLWFLWLLTLAVSAVAWLYLEISFVRKRGVSNRSRLTGYDLARQILDRHQFTRTAVQAVPKISFGSSLAELAEALYETIHLTEGSKGLIPVRLGTPKGRIFHGAVLGSWILVACGIVLGTWIRILGEISLISCFLLGLASLPGEWEVAERAVANLGSIERLGTDERIQMKQLVKALRWNPLAEMVGVPLRILGLLPLKGRSKKKKVGSVV